MFFPVIISLKKKTWKSLCLHSPISPIPGPAGTWCWVAAWPCLPGGQRPRRGNPTALGRPIPLARPATSPGDAGHAIGPLDGREKHVVMLTMIFSRKPGDLMWWFKKIITNGDFSWSFNDSESWFHRDETIAVLWLASPWDDALVMPMSMRESSDS